MGVYLGNPNAHNLGNAIMLPRFFKALGTNSRFSSASADQLPLIQPEADALLMLALAHTLSDEQRVNTGHLEPLIEGLEQLADARG